MNIPRRFSLRMPKEALSDKADLFFKQLLIGVVETNPLLPSSFADLVRSDNWAELWRVTDILSKQLYESATKHFVASQFSHLIKKYPFQKGLLPFDPERNALDLFALTERRVKRLNIKHRILSIDRSRDLFRKEFGTARNWIRSVIGSVPNYKHIFSACDFGPGASIGTHGNATNFAQKWSGVWSVSAGCIHHGFGGILNNDQLFMSLLKETGRSLVCLDPVLGFSKYMGRIEIVGYNKISLVPKTAKIHRTIAVEPLLNGFVQKGIDAVLRKKLLRFGINLSDQGRNQELARQGSIRDSDDSFVTIDLKSASDSISIELVRRLLPEAWFGLLDRTRSHAYKLGDNVLTYHKFCSMGNGFCFPLETLIFSSACIASGAGVPFVDFAVYGDDIVVRKQYAGKVLALLKHWGFQHNPDKTFLEGPFRESCGKDYFGGQDVRPYTLDERFDTVESLFKFLNLTRNTARKETFFSGVRELVVRQVPVDFLFFRPFQGNVDTGIDSSGDEHLYSPFCGRKDRRWVWRELIHSSIQDRNGLDRVMEDGHLAMCVALRGATSVNFGLHKGSPEVTVRNRTHTGVTRKGYSSTSNWLPTMRSLLNSA